MANSQDWGILAVYVLASLVLLFNIVTSAVTPQWVNTYQNIAYLTIPLSIVAIALANVQSNKFLDFNFFPNGRMPDEASNKIDVSIVAAIIVSMLAITISLITTVPDFLNFFTLSFIPPLQSFSSSQNGIQTAFIIVVIGPMGEELLFRNLLNPTFKRTIRNYGAHLIIGFFGLAVMFLNNFTIGFLLLVLAFLIWRVEPINSYIVGSAGAVSFLAFLLSSTLFSSYHLGVYSILANPQSAILGAGIFGMIVSYFNDFFETGIGSWLIHSLTNGYVIYNAFPSTLMLEYVIIMVAVMIALILIASRIKKFVFRPGQVIHIGF